MFTEDCKPIKYALITGITGQDGSYLAEFLLHHTECEYHVYGIMRRNSSYTSGRIEHIFNHPRLHLVFGDVTDSASLTSTINKIENLVDADMVIEVYNLAAQSHVGVSFEVPLYTATADAVGTLNMLEAIRQSRHSKRFRFYQASTSEMFGSSPPPQSETTIFHPRSPYGCAKLYAHWITINYREAYGLFACSGVLFNHESNRRGETFVTRKISIAVAKIFRGLRPGPENYIELGNLDAKRDWGYAPDYVKAMWLMLQRDNAEDYVISTNESHTVREFVELAFSCIGVQILWSGERGSLGEEGIDLTTGKVLVKSVKRYYRAAEVEHLEGDSTRARKELGWEPTKTFEEIVREMVYSDINMITQK